MLERIVREYRIDLIVLFGSCARGRDKAGSDLDIAVRFVFKGLGRNPERLGSLQRALTEALGGERDVDLVEVNFASPVLMWEIARTGIPLYEKKGGLFASFRSYASRLYQDTEKFRRRRLAYLKSWLTKTYATSV